MTFQFQPAVRVRVPLVIGIAGASGAGKTMSALRLARGLAGGDDHKIGVLDTEGGRALHYAPAPHEQPGGPLFGFQHGDIKPDFTPETYADAIAAADAAGFEVIVLDSFSHEWDGVGGLHDIHDAIVAQMIERARKRAERYGQDFDEDSHREKVSLNAWNEP